MQELEVKVARDKPTEQERHEAPAGDSDDEVGKQPPRFRWMPTSVSSILDTPPFFSLPLRPASSRSPVCSSGSVQLWMSPLLFPPSGFVLSGTVVAFRVLARLLQVPTPRLLATQSCFTAKIHASEERDPPLMHSGLSQGCSRQKAKIS